MLLKSKHQTSLCFLATAYQVVFPLLFLACRPPLSERGKCSCVCCPNRVLKDRYINHWELSTLLLGDQKGRPGVTAASPMWEPEPELGFSPLPSGGVLGRSVWFMFNVLLIQKMTRKPCGGSWGFPCFMYLGSSQK